MSMLGMTLCALLVAAPLAPPPDAAPSTAVQGSGGQETVRLKASVVVASSEGSEMSRALQPLEARLRTLFPYTSYRSFTEYTKVVPPGEALELWLPDGRRASLQPLPAKAGLAPAARPIRVSIEGGEEFESRAACGHTTVVQVRGTGPHHRNGGRVFLVFEETCAGEHPRRLLEPGQ
jgi:hypothetical protein